MKTIHLLASTIVIFSLLISCSTDDIDKSLIPSSANFNLNRVDYVLFTRDGGLLIAGVNDLNSTIIKTDYKFGKMWIRNNYEWGHLVQGSGWGSSFYGIQIVKMFQRADGSYVCIGSVMEGGDVIMRSTLVIILDQNGKQIHTYDFDGLGAVNALQTSDGGYILFGSGMIKLDENFVAQWDVEKTGYDYNEWQITSTGEGGFATTGSYLNDQTVLKTYSRDGHEGSSFIYKHNETPFEESGFDLTQLSDNGFLIVGRAGVPGPGVVNSQIIRTNAAGDTIWTKRLGNSMHSWLHHIVSQEQTEFILEGTEAFDNPSSILVRINSDGEILDSVKTEKFQMMLYSPLGYYIRVKNFDQNHVEFTKIEPADLFN